MVLRYTLLGLLFSHIGASEYLKSICPMLGSAFPKPVNLNSSSEFRNAVSKVNTQITEALNTGKSSDGDFSFNYTAFSLSIFSTQEAGLLWQRHHTIPSVSGSTAGVKTVDADSEYRVGSISKLLTMYNFLISAGDRHLNDPITEHIPQLAAAAKESTNSPHGVLPMWEDITIADLACHISGIMEDYGLDDAEFTGPRYKGVPALNESEEPTCGFGNGTHFFTCTKEAEFTGITKQPALFPVGATPSYSNTGYDLVGAALESILGRSMEDIFNNSMVKPLGLQHTYFQTPNDYSYGVIPLDPHRSGWNVVMGSSNPDGGNVVSTNDLATIGKSMMNFTLLSPSMTRRWMKPRTFTSDPTSNVGNPWEIWRWEANGQLYDLYTKQGDTGVYSSFIGLVPALDFGFTSLTASTQDRSSVSLDFVNLIAEAMVPAVDQAAREQAHAIYSGRYTTGGSGGNGSSSTASHLNTSSLTITTDDRPGLLVTEWISRGHDFLAQLGGPGLDFRLFPNELYPRPSVGFSASWQNSPRHYQKKPFQQSCQQWVDVGGYDYGNVNIGLFVFELDGQGNKAVSLNTEALRTVLERQS